MLRKKNESKNIHILGKTEQRLTSRPIRGRIIIGRE